MTVAPHLASDVFDWFICDFHENALAASDPTARLMSCAVRTPIRRRPSRRQITSTIAISLHFGASTSTTAIPRVQEFLDFDRRLQQPLLSSPIELALAATPQRLRNRHCNDCRRADGQIKADHHHVSDRPRTTITALSCVGRVRHFHQRS